MLKGIKEIINQQKSFSEAADLVLENEKLDDSIILSESPAEELAYEPKEEPVEKPESTPEETPVETPAEEPLPVSGDDQLPEPLAKETGEPAEIGSGDLLGVEIDLATNTQVDTLPVPPANAGDAISDADDIMNQHVDSGFGGDDPAPAPADEGDIMNAPTGEDIPKEDPEVVAPTESEDSSDDLMDAPVEEGVEVPHEVKESTGDDILSEAITVGDKPAEKKPEESTPDNGDDLMDAPVEDNSGDAPDATPAEEQPADEKPADAPEENPVTAAVKDKVAEMDDQTTAAATGASRKEVLLKKLGSLTKGLEDAKRAVMDSPI